MFDILANFSSFLVSVLKFATVIAGILKSDAIIRYASIFSVDGLMLILLLLIFLIAANSIDLSEGCCNTLCYLNFRPWSTKSFAFWSLGYWLEMSP